MENKALNEYFKLQDKVEQRIVGSKERLEDAQQKLK